MKYYLRFLIYDNIYILFKNNDSYIQEIDGIQDLDLEFSNFDDLIYYYKSDPKNIDEGRGKDHIDAKEELQVLLEIWKIYKDLI